MHAPRRILPLILAPLMLLAASACGDDSVSSSQSSGNNAETPENNAESPNNNAENPGNNDDPIVEEPAEPPPVPSDDWCTRTTPGKAGAQVLALDLSRAHADARFFGPHESNYHAIDTALAAALETWEDPSTAPPLGPYASASSDLCALSAAEGSLGPASVVMEGSTAIVRPGTGAWEIPAEASAVLLDFRDLPNAPELEEVLVGALGEVLSAPFTRASARVRQHRGMVDEIFSAQNVHRMQIVTLEGEEVQPAGTRDLKIGVWTSAQMPPVAAEIAADLRLQARALLLGENIAASTAESFWNGVGEQGIAYRGKELMLSEGERWPDIIPQDRRTWTRTDAVEALQELSPSAVSPGEDARHRIHTLDLYDVGAPPVASPGTARAALITAHGAANRFFAFFEEVGRGVDTALPEILADIGPETDGNRGEIENLIRRLGHHLHDGHVFTRDRSYDNTSRNAGVIGYIPKRIEHVDGQPVIEWSASEQLRPGDRILSINGEPIEDVYKRLDPYIAAATPENALYQKANHLLGYQEAATFVLEGADGEERTETIEPIAWDESYQGPLFGPPSTRLSGSLEDLGAPEIYYINLDASRSPSDLVLYEQLTSLFNAEHVVLDMRGYPGTWDGLYALAGSIVGREYLGPRFGALTHTGPKNFERVRTQYRYAGPWQGMPFEGDAVLLVGPQTQSAAENFSMGLVSENSVTVMGRQSSGSNGNITGLILPGNFGITFTGLKVQYSHGDTFHGVGIQPDIRVERSQEDIANGIDRKLQAAIEELQSR